MVGGIYAAGKLDELESWARAIRRTDMLSLLDVSWKKDGLFKGDKIIDTLIQVVGRQKIEDLPIPFTAIATDLNTHQDQQILPYTTGLLHDYSISADGTTISYTRHISQTGDIMMLN